MPYLFDNAQPIIGTTTISSRVSQDVYLDLGSIKETTYISVLPDWVILSDEGSPQAILNEIGLSTPEIYRLIIDNYADGHSESRYENFDILNTNNDKLLQEKYSNIPFIESTYFFGKSVNFLPSSKVVYELPSNPDSYDPEKYIISETNTDHYYITFSIEPVDSAFSYVNYMPSDRVLVAFGDPTGQRADNWSNLWVNYVDTVSTPSPALEFDPLEQGPFGDERDLLSEVDTLTRDISDSKTTLNASGLDSTPDGYLTYQDNNGKTHNTELGKSDNPIFNISVDMAIQSILVHMQSSENNWISQASSVASSIYSSYGLFSNMKSAILDSLDILSDGMNEVTSLGPPSGRDYGNEIIDRVQQAVVSAGFGQAGIPGSIINWAIDSSHILIRHSLADVEAGSSSIGAAPRILSDGHQDIYIGDVWDNVLSFGDGDDGAYGGGGNDELHGGGGSDALIGGGGNDRLYGDDGRDLLQGGEGDDVLSGGGGDDILDGGSGSDTAVFSAARGDATVTFDGDTAVVVTPDEGTDRLLDFEFLSFAGEVYSVASFADTTPPPSGPDWRLIAPTGNSVEIGGSGRVLGSGGFQEISVLDQPGAITFDASFNKGGDLVRLAGDASDWQVVRFGSSAVFTDGDTSVTLPLGAAGLAVVFDDGVRSLHFDTATEEIKIGDQVFGDELVAIAAPADSTPLPTGADADASARLLLSSDGSVTAGGSLQIFGTMGSETVTVTGGAVKFDQSFNRGGDEVVLNQSVADFTVARSGSNVILDSDGTDLVIPIGSAGMTISFAGDERLLIFDEAEGAIFLGEQAIELTPVALAAIA